VRIGRVKGRPKTKISDRIRNVLICLFEANGLSKNRGVSGFPGFCQKKMPFPDKGDFTELLIDVFLSEQDAIS
jgi:hypothetical protein